MSEHDIDLIAHLMRRAGFGSTRDEQEKQASRDYEAVVEDLVEPEQFPEVEEDLIERYYRMEGLGLFTAVWIYRMVNTQRPLEEKMTLFLHHLFATALHKTQHTILYQQINMFRRVSLSNLRTILTELSKDPAMIFWLDNNENRKDEPNENYGRELLELFSMGVGNYTEQDLKMAARAFTGWTFIQPIPLYPHSYYPTAFEYRRDDHDDGVKTFLGETGRFNGEDIIDIIVRQPATARFIARHLYNFFVSDEPQVPAWNETPPQDPETIDDLVEAYFASDGDMRAMLRVLFNSDSFKKATFKKVKSPAELVAGVIKLVGTYRFPAPGILKYSVATGLMGQLLLNPPTVEGWHTGKEWIDGGTLNERVNFAADEVGDVTKPGIKAIVDRLAANGASTSPEKFVDECLDLMGPVEVGDDTRQGLLKFARSGGDIGFDTETQREESAQRVSRMLQLIVAAREYQFA